MSPRGLLLAGVVLSAAVSLQARADEPTTPPAPPPADTVIKCPACEEGHWSREPVRAFVSLTAVGGYLYLKPRFSFGYGRPFALWGGVDVTPMVTPDYVGGYSGLRLQIPWFDFRAGARAVHAFNRQFLPQQPSYSLVDLAELTGRQANYVSLEAEIAAAIPAGPGDILGLFTAESIQLVPAGNNVYDEALRVVVSPPPVFRGRLGYVVHALPEGNAHIGLVGEVIEIVDRKAQVYRAGVVATFDIDDHFQAVGTLLVPVYGPDSLGLAGADYTELGIRYRWASGHTHAPQERLPPEQDTALDTGRRGDGSEREPARLEQ
jgi:hypothetical protein